MQGSEAVRLGDIAERVPGMTAATRTRLGSSPDASLPARFVSLEDFEDGLLKAEGSAYMEAPAAPGSAPGRRGGTLAPGDLCFSRVGGRFAGFVQDDFGKVLCCSENIVAAHLAESARPCAAALARWISMGAGGQMERVATARGRAACWEAIASILVPTAILPGDSGLPEPPALAWALAAYDAAVRSLGKAAATASCSRSNLDSEILSALER